jgi:DNA transformation protein
VAAGPDADHISELFAEFGPVSVRRMFGGAGIYADGVMIAILDEGVIYLKTSEDGRGAFEREGCGPFQYDTKNGKQTIKTYWRMPERLYDDPDELAVWARQALAAARQGKPSVKRRVNKTVKPKKRR